MPGTLIVKAVIKLTKARGLQVIAEGVETREQLLFVKRHDCDMFQGFLCSRPEGRGTGAHAAQRATSQPCLSKFLTAWLEPNRALAYPTTAQ
jgi:EAL domain-containing protein (putative c-di-GMP-specific phosphodiesterase class I)